MSRRVAKLPPPRPGLAALQLAATAAVTLAAAALGGAATAEGLAWYAQLDKPGWTPPDAVFGPVWTVLYVLMAVAAWLVWRAGGWRAWGALALFVLQLALNVGWSVLFFAQQRPVAALLGIVVLLAAVAGTASAFARWSRPAAALLLPYLAWLVFAAALNAAIVGLGGGL